MDNEFSCVAEVFVRWDAGSDRPGGQAERGGDERTKFFGGEAVGARERVPDPVNTGAVTARQVITTRVD